jgi:hypothetical protein
VVHSGPWFVGGSVDPAGSVPGLSPKAAAAS